EPIGSLQGWNSAAQFGNGANGATNHYRNDIYSLSYIRTFSPTIVNQVSVTYRPRYFSNIWLSYDPASRWAEQLGVRNVYSQNNFPMFSSSGYVPLGNTGGGYDGPIRPGEASNTVTVVKGKH